MCFFSHRISKHKCLFNVYLTFSNYISYNKLNVYSKSYSVSSQKPTITSVDKVTFGI